MAAVCQRCSHPNSDEAKFCLQCGAMLESDTLAAPEDPLLGRVLLDRYRVLSVLGEGGMGKVYLAEQKMGTATRKVAIKTLHPELGADPQLIARFHRECETVIALSHPNTVQFYDFGEFDGTLFIVMEYIEGESLAHVLERGAIDPARADRILIQICGSLSEAHQHGVVHRDLKPENVLLTERGGQPDFVKVLDFGIAKRSEAEDRAQAKLTKQGMVLGTPPYMSPEQFSGQQLDARSDIYSLGIMTYEMLTGRLPFEAATPWEWATKHLTADPTPIEAHPHGADLPDRKKGAIVRALHKDREQRHGSILELMHDFTGMGDAASAWTLATTPGAAAATPQPQPQAQAQPGTGAAPARPAAPTPGPMSQAGPSDVAYAATMATPSSGQMAVTPPPPTGVPTGGTTGAQPVSTGIGKVLAILATVALVLAVGGGVALWYFLGRGDAGDVALASAGDPEEANATGAGPEAADEPDEPPSVPSTPSEPSEPAEQAGGAANDEGSGSNDQDTAGEQDTADEGGSAAEDEPERSPRAARRKARLARAQTQLRAAKASLARNDLAGAARSLRQARRTAGTSFPALRSVQSELARTGSNKVGIYMQQGKCKDAQALYRQLRGAGADRPSRIHFSDDWCPRP